MYATLSSGTLTLFTVKRDGQSKKRSFSLYGSAIGLDSNVIDGSKHCFRVLDGTLFVVLQAESQTSQMEWSIAIAHSISMENGGGILFDKEKLGITRDGGFGLDNAGFPIIDGYSVTKNRNSSVVFSKPIHDEGRLNPISKTSYSTKLDIELSLPMEHFVSGPFDAHTLHPEVISRPSNQIRCDAAMAYD